METGMTKKIKNRLAICAMFVLGAGLAHAAVMEINLASAYPDDNFQTQNLRQFAEDGRLATSGQVNIRVQSGGKLLKAPLDIFNEKQLAKLDESTRKKILDAAQVAETRGWKLSQDSDQNYENQLAASKVNVSTMEPYIRKYFDRIGENLARDWLKLAGSDELLVLLKYTTERSMR